jgi:DNA-binding LacI/PurR family transcriptional regulator
MAAGPSKGRARRRPGASGEVTIKDIAAHLGLSHATVSRALNDYHFTSAETKERVWRAATALGYTRNAGAVLLRGASSRLIGLVAPDLHNEFYSAVINVLSGRYAESGMQLVVTASANDPERELRAVLALREARAAGILLTPSTAPLRRTIDLLAAVPTVQLARAIPLLDAPAVEIDHALGTRRSTEHLVELGHRRIAFVGSERDLAVDRERVRGYTEALEAAKIGVQPSLLRLGRPSFAAGIDAARRLLALGRPPTAIVASNIQLTLGVLGAVSERGFTVPRDISVVGYGDPEWFAWWGPGITTIQIPIAMMAETAASLLLQRDGDGRREERKRRRVLLAPELVLRGSTAPVEVRSRRSRR